MNSYQGGCHCGAVTYEVRALIESVVRCNCSICTKKGAVFFKVEPENFTLISGKENLSLYQFNLNIAKHLLCKTCGIYCFHHPRSTPDLMAINANTLDSGFDLNRIEEVKFDGKSWDTNELHKIGATSTT